KRSCFSECMVEDWPSRFFCDSLILGNPHRRRRRFGSILRVLGRQRQVQTRMCDKVPQNWASIWAYWRDGSSAALARERYSFERRIGRTGESCGGVRGCFLQKKRRPSNLAVLNKRHKARRTNDPGSNAGRHDAIHRKVSRGRSRGALPADAKSNGV